MRTFAKQTSSYLFLCASIIALQAGGAEAPALMGARHVIDLVQAAETGGAPAGASADTSPQVIFRANLARFASNSAALPPEVAARQWVALYNRFWTLPSGASQTQIYGGYGARKSSTAQIQDVLAAVPGPAAWEPLLNIVNARPAPAAHADRDMLLRMYVFYLNGRFDRCLDDLKRTTDNVVKTRPESAAQLRYAVQSLRGGLRKLSGDTLPGGMVAAFERQLDEVTAPGDQNLEITIPDLLALTDTNCATRLIEKAARLLYTTLTVKGGEATHALVRRVVMQHLSEIRTPPWNLVGGADTIAFYEALTNKFPRRSAAADLNADETPNLLVRSRNDDWMSRQGWEQATRKYQWALVACGRTDEAVKLATSREPAGRWEEGLDFGHGNDGIAAVPPQTLYEFLDRVLTQKPEKPLWSAFAATALAAGHANEVLAKLRAFQQDTANKPPAQNGQDQIVADLTLNATDEAMAGLRKSVRIERTGGSAEIYARQVSEAQAAAGRMAQLGKLLDRPDWIDEGITLMRSIETQQIPRSMSYYDAESSLAGVLTENRQYAEAEQALLRQMTALKQKKADAPPEYSRFGGGRDETLSYLVKLVDLYAAANRADEIVALLRDAPWWGAADLQEVGAFDYGCGGSADRLAKVAAALLATGQTNAALTVAREAVRREPGFDPGYQVLLNTGDPDLPVWLDTRYARDKFEERPLIWKASALLKQGRLEEAEQSVRQAIKVDPTDGETRAGDRVRSYAVLADVLEARGKTNDAAFFRRVVESVRMAEKGDALKEAGLVQRSLPLYEKASELFADAYCVQWRLAERLWAMGKREEAEQHYAIAFERMPEQFGQIAHLCFGCEGVFDKSESRSVAERVLQRLAQNGPPRPQVHFLLGQLREKQGRLFEAYQEFQKSVEIDPGYLDGWMRLHEVARETMVSQADRDRIALTMMKLDPIGRHANVEPADIADLRTLWTVLEQRCALVDLPPASILPLPASARQIEEAKKHPAGKPGDLDMSYEWNAWSQERNYRTPGEVITASQLVQNMLNFRLQVEMFANNDPFANSEE